MTKFIFPITTILMLVLNIFFIGILNTNEAGISELFIKCEPSIEEFVFDSTKQEKDENRKGYQKLILDENIQDKEKSLLPLILIQLMISSFVMCFSKLDLKRNTAICLIHFVFMAIISIFIIPYILAIDKELIIFAIIITWLAANFGFRYIITH